MKKIKWMICLLAIGASAQAYTPQTGDIASYSNSTINSNGGISSSHNAWLLIDNYDQPSDTYSYTAILTFQDGLIHKISGTGAGLKYAESLRVNCGLHGTEESIIVGAGTFQTCRIDFDGTGEIVTWHGDVSFGVVKEERQNTSTGETYRSELESFHQFNP